MATGKSGHIDLTSGVFTARVNWSETYDPTSNKSIVQIDSVKIKSSHWYQWTYYLDGTIKIAGQTVLSMNSTTPTHHVRINTQNTFYEVSPCGPWKSNELVHSDDGKLSVGIVIDFSGYTTSGKGGSGWNVSGSSTVTLTDIPRASAIAATDANIGSVSLIAVTRRSDRYTHSVMYRFGTQTGYLKADGTFSTTEEKITASSIALSIPQSWYNQIPTAKYGICTLSCKTYSGTTQIGNTTTATFTVNTVADECTPAIIGDAYDLNLNTMELTGDYHVFVRYRSEVSCSMTATPKHGATIAKMYINDIETPNGSLIIRGIEHPIISFRAVDSRGYSATVELHHSMIQYIPLTVNLAAKRKSAASNDVIVSISGNFFNGSFGSQGNTLDLKVRADGGNYQNVSFSKSGNTYSGTITLYSLDYQDDHTIEVKAMDSLGYGEVVKTVTITKGIPNFLWAKEYFRLNIPLLLGGGIKPLSSIASGEDANAYTNDGIYAVGSDSNATLIANLPSQYGGLLIVFDALGSTRQSGNYLYKTQVYISRSNLEPIYWRSAGTGSTGEWSFTTWTVR